MEIDDTGYDASKWSRAKLFDEVMHSINGNNKVQALEFLKLLESYCYARDAERKMKMEQIACDLLRLAKNL